MAVVAFSGFETGDAVEAAALAGTASVQSSIVRSGGYALRINPATTATGSYLLRGVGATGASAEMSLTNAYVTAWLYIATLPAADSEEILRVAAGGALKAALRIASDGTLSLYDQSGGGLVAAGATVLSTGRWYEIRLLVGTESGFGASDAPYSLAIDGAAEFSGSNGSLAEGVGTRVYAGKVTNRNGQSIDVYWDDLVVDDAAFCANPRVVRLDVDGAGNYTAWTGTSADIDDVPHDSDTTYLASSTSGQAETGALETLGNAGGQHAVKSVKAIAIVRDEGGSSSLKLRLRSGSTDSDTTAADPGSTYVARCAYHATDPATGATWATDALIGVEVGVVNNANVAVRCTAACAMVLFVPVVPVFAAHHRRRRAA